jgi:carbonic anhydrase/acetyltransferase-like protein (isoleucine patch superfamily)
MPIYALDGVAPEIHPTAWVAPGAVVIGNVALEEGASVWFNAVIRGDNERVTIGPRCNVQDGCVLHSDPGFPLTLEADVTLGHMAIVHGCTVGAGALIGMGATVLNGAKIGEGALVGANALIPEGKDIPAGSMVLGSPAKVIRDLTEAQMTGLKATAAHYVSNADRFKTGMSEIPSPK